MLGPVCLQSRGMEAYHTPAPVAILGCLGRFLQTPPFRGWGEVLALVQLQGSLSLPLSGLARPTLLEQAILQGKAKLGLQLFEWKIVQ